MAADLPPEIIAEIFSRLPVESLLRFRSTSKSLKSLIDSHKFINLHLQNSLNFNLILQRNTDLYQVDFPNLTKSIIPLNHPFRFTRNSTAALIGSCNGLLAISNGVIDFIYANDAKEITLWNPNTRKHRIIPFLSIPNLLESFNRLAVSTHGFGFDPLTGDYKLIRISYLVTPQNPFYDPQVRLFSSKTNSWKIIPSMRYILRYVRSMGVFVENSLHWIMTPKIHAVRPFLIIAFNLTLEIFNEVLLPEEVNSNESFEIDVSVLGGCLCMSVIYQTTKIDVWVMKEYGSRDSWCKLFTLVESCFTSRLEPLKPLGYSSDGGKVLLEGIPDLLEEDEDHRKLFWYDLKSEQASYVKGIPDLDAAMFCVGSLVPPSFPVAKCGKKDNHTSKSKRRDDFLSRGFKLRL